MGNQSHPRTQLHTSSQHAYNIHGFEGISSSIFKMGFSLLAHRNILTLLQGNCLAAIYNLLLCQRKNIKKRLICSTGHVHSQRENCISIKTIEVPKMMEYARESRQPCSFFLLDRCSNTNRRFIIYMFFCMVLKAIYKCPQADSPPGLDLLNFSIVAAFMCLQSMA